MQAFIHFYFVFAKPKLILASKHRSVSRNMLSRKNNLAGLQILNYRFLASHSDYTAWFGSEPFGNPDRFTCDAAHIRETAFCDEME